MPAASHTEQEPAETEPEPAAATPPAGRSARTRATPGDGDSPTTAPIPPAGRSARTRATPGDGDSPTTTPIPPAGRSASTRATPAGVDADPVIEAERTHLMESRKFLGLMRDDVLSLEALGGDPVSEEYLKADLYRRAEALKDLPDTPLFFGRLDYRHRVGEQAPGEDPGDDSGEDGAGGGEQFHIGRRHVHDPAGRPVVIDWRAPVSRPFYRASQVEPMGLTRRRRFGFSGGDLTAFEDEVFGPAPAAATPTTPATTPTTPAAALATPATPVTPVTTGMDALTGQPSRIMLDEIERPRSGPMRDIVATIQPDQDDIVRADADQSICVQGAPGTGKTAVGLHRVAYLMYAYRERMARRGVLVIGPNRAFLSYIRNVLPALGETQVTQVTMADLVADRTGLGVKASDEEDAARIKGDARMAEVLRRALWARLAEPAEPILLARGSRRWRVPVHEISGLVDELRERGVRYGAGRDMLAHRIAHVILTRMEAAGEACDDRTHDSVRRTKQVRAAVDAIWPKVDPVRVVYTVLADRQELARAADGLLDGAEQNALCWETPSGHDGRAGRGPGSARWSAADLVLIDEAADLIGRTASAGHVVVDEAQDLSPMECRAIARRCETGSVTVLGDLAQGTTPSATTSWPEMLAHLGKRDAQLRVLEVGYRVPREILDFANRLLDLIAPALTRAASLRHDPDALDIVTTTDSGLAAALLVTCAEAADRPGSVAIIAADDQTAALSKVLDKGGLGHAVLQTARNQASGGDGTGGDEAPGSVRLTVVPVSLAKGLEFDQVVVVEPARITASGHRGTQRLYVALTRAVSRLTVLHTEPLPALLR